MRYNAFALEQIHLSFSDIIQDFVRHESRLAIVHLVLLVNDIEVRHALFKHWPDLTGRRECCANSEPEQLVVIRFLRRSHLLYWLVILRERGLKVVWVNIHVLVLVHFDNLLQLGGIHRYYLDGLNLLPRVLVHFDNLLQLGGIHRLLPHVCRPRLGLEQI